MGTRGSRAGPYVFVQRAHPGCPGLTHAGLHLNQNRPTSQHVGADAGKRGAETGSRVVHSRGGEVPTRLCVTIHLTSASTEGTIKASGCEPARPTKSSRSTMICKKGAPVDAISCRLQQLSE